MRSIFPIALVLVLAGCGCDSTDFKVTDAAFTAHMDVSLRGIDQEHWSGAVHRLEVRLTEIKCHKEVRQILVYRDDREIHKELYADGVGSNHTAKIDLRGGSVTIPALAATDFIHLPGIKGSGATPKALGSFASRYMTADKDARYRVVVRFADGERTVDLKTWKPIQTGTGQPIEL